MGYYTVNSKRGGSKRETGLSRHANARVEGRCEKENPGATVKVCKMWVSERGAYGHEKAIRHEQARDTRLMNRGTQGVGDPYV